MNLPRLQFITNDRSPFSHTEQVEIACKNGIKFIQLRLKNRSPQEVEHIVMRAKKFTKQFNSLLILNDYVDIGTKLRVDGVHVGQNDEALSQLFGRLANGIIIGATANSFHDIKHIAKFPVNYIGLGPFRFTETKKCLKTILGIETIRTILQFVRNHKIMIPIYAIGGIVIGDLAELNKTNIYGIALSSAIARNTDMEKNIKLFQNGIIKWN